MYDVNTSLDWSDSPLPSSGKASVYYLLFMFSHITNKANLWVIYLKQAVQCNKWKVCEAQKKKKKTDLHSFA